MHRFRISIIAKLVLLVFAVALPFSAILAWSINAQFDNELTSAQHHSKVIANSIAVRTEIILNQTRAMLVGAAQRPGVKAMNRTHCDPVLGALHDILPQYANINVLDRQWRLVCSATIRDPKFVYKSKHSDVFEKMVMADDMVISPPFRGPLTGKRVVFAAYPVKDDTNKIIGAVTAPIDLNALASIVSGSALPVGAITRIVDGDGIIIISYPDTDKIGKLADIIAASASASASAKRTDTFIKRDANGIERIYAFSQMKGTDWVTLTGFPTSTALAAFRYDRNTVLSALFMVLVLAAILAYLVARQIARPIRELQRDTEILAYGNHGHRSEVVSRDEIGQLAKTFNNMAETLQVDEEDRKKTELNIRRLNRVYAVLSQINTLIVRVQDRGELFEEACKVVTDAGGFRMSMIVSVDHDTQQLISIVSSGKEDELLSAAKNLLSTTEGMKTSMVWQAIASKEAVISNNIHEDSRLTLGEYYAKAGVHSMVLLPLIVSGDAVGVIALYASESEFFQQDEMKLLTELADDIAFAIDHIDKQERLNFLAYYDELTGLANHSLFSERLAQHIRSASREGRRLAIGLIDLERFKSINDSLGRTAGDALLKQVATWLTEQVSDPGLLARIDADHFAVLLPVIRSDGNLAVLTEKLINALLEHPFLLNDTIFRISIKIGIALYPEDGSDADTLFKNAEAALKKAKYSGDRYLFYTQKMTEAVAGRLILENQLRDAIDNEEFVLYYQPKVNLITGEINGAEALIRWNDPRTGLVSPAEFIPILEETGLIYDVGRWALHKAIEEYIRWRAAGFDIGRIAVNVSPLQLRKKDFTDVIEQALSVDPGAATGLELEITESLIMDDVEQSIVTLHEVRAMGVHIAIDDFGTGFSSLSYLARLPLDTLKIDRVFISDIHTPEGLELVSTIIRVAHALKLKVVAEGVETEKQLRQLGRLDCDEIQGYLFSKPVPADSFEAEFLTRPRYLKDSL